MSPDTPPISKPVGLSHVRLTVTDIVRAKAFYAQLFGAAPAFDFSDQIDEPGVKDDPARGFGGAGFALGDQILGLRPVAAASDKFDSTRVGLDHVSVLLGSVDDLHAAVNRLEAAGVEQGDYTELTDMGLAIVSVQDPDDINVELSAALPPSDLCPEPWDVRHVQGPACHEATVALTVRAAGAKAGT